MNFYSVKIGQVTRRGGFNENVSFVCKTENESISDVLSYWELQYKGFDVRVAVVEDIVEVKIEKSFDFGHNESEEVKEYKKEIRELKSDLNKMTKTHFIGEMENTHYPECLKEIVSKIKDTGSELRDLENKAVMTAEGYLEKVNIGKVHWVRKEKGFNSTYSKFGYQAYLKGKLIMCSDDDGLEK